MPLDCPICGQKKTLFLLSQEYQDYLSQEYFTLLRCQVCGCGVTQSVDLNKLGNYYGSDYYNRQSGKFSPIIEKIFRFNHYKNAKRLYRRFRPKNVLEMGCGRAYLLRALKQFNCQVYCLESQTAAEWILNNPEIQVVTSSTHSEWPFESEYFQLIIFWHVLEHLPDPMLALQQATRVLAPQQILCISVPNIDSFQSRLHLPTWFHLDVPRHLFHFNKKALIDWLQRHDYDIIQVTSGDAIQNLYGWFQSLANLFTPQHPNVLYRFLQSGFNRQKVAFWPLFVQLLTAIIWLPVGLFGFLLEEILGFYGTVTIYARKKSFTANNQKKIPTHK